MAIISKLTIIFILSFSFVLALLVFYLMSNLPKAERKRQISEITSQLINFVLFLWLAKVLLKLPLFVQDPLAVLAYPSNSEAFYLAALFTGLAIYMKSKKKTIAGSVFGQSLLQVILGALFFYEFIQLTWRNHPFSFPYLVVYGFLLAGSYLLQGRMSRRMGIFVILAAGAAGFLILSFMLPYLTVFGYIMDPWFLGIVFPVFFGLLFMKKLEKQTQSALN